MASDLTLRIEHASGETSTLTVPTPTAIDTQDVTLATIRIERALDRVARCSARVFRADWRDVLTRLDRRDDEFYVDQSDGSTVFGGRLDDWQFEGETVSVKIDSFETDALAAEPPPSFTRTDISDQQTALDMIGLVSAPVSAGTVEQTMASIDTDETHRSPGAMLRTLTKITGANLAYRPDGAVDYLTDRGTDRAVEIAPASGVVISEPRIRQTVREEVTHVRAVSQSDPTAYEEALVTTDGREHWYVDRIDSTAASRLQGRATRLANEYADAPEYIEIETTLDPLAIDGDIALGDRYPVRLPAYGIAQQLRVFELTRHIDADGETVDVLLTNREATVAGRNDTPGSEVLP